MSQYVNSIYEDYIGGEKNQQIIIDLGSFYTKVGYAQESEPREIIKTLEIFEFKSYYTDIINNIKNQYKEFQDNDADKINEVRKTDIFKYKKNFNSKEFKNSLEEFISNILFNSLQIHKKKRDKSYNCILLTDFNSKLKDFYALFAELLVNTNIVSSVVLLNSLITPIYSSGLTSGVIINLGSLSSSIIPINNNSIYKQNIRILKISICELQHSFIVKLITENFLSKSIEFDTEEMAKSLQSSINDLFIRSLLCLNKGLSDSAYASNSETPYEYFKKFKSDWNKTDISISGKSFSVSILNRVLLGEQIFSNSETSTVEDYFYNLVNNTETNIVSELLDMFLELSIEARLKLCQNLILSGGLSHGLGLYKRFIEELTYKLNNEAEYSSLTCLNDKFKIHKVLYPNNCLAWIGASLVTGIDKLRFSRFSYEKAGTNVNNTTVASDLNYLTDGDKPKKVIYNNTVKEILDIYDFIK